MNNRKKIMYIGILVLITVIVSITYFSYAFLTQTDVHNGKLNIVAGTLTYRLKIDNQEANTIIVPANDTKEIEVKVKSLNSINSKFELYYLTINGVDVNYSSAGDLPSGTLGSDEEDTIYIILTNYTSSNKEVTFGIKESLVSNNVELSTNMNSITVMSECNVPIGTVYNFDYTGSAQIFTPTCKGKYKVELWGAEGGGNGTGGKGGYTSGEIELDSETDLYVYVGKGLGDCYKKNNVGSNFNGGGFCTSDGNARYWGAGGGATDIRLVSGSGFDSLKSRIMVAAGAGAGFNDTEENGGSSLGGDAGGLTGYNANNISYYGSNYGYALGATQINAGQCHTSYNVDYCRPGTFGAGGSRGGPAHSGGGGGYYGGAQSGHVDAAAGGSSFISGYSGCNAISESSTSSSIVHTNQPNHYSDKVFSNGVMIDGKGCNWSTGSAASCGANQPQPNGTNAVGHTGNGYARITYLGNGDTAPGTTWTFDYTGSEQKFTASRDGAYQVELWGAQGGTHNSVIGYGGYTKGNIDLVSNTDLYIYVGGQGTTSINVPGTYAGGYNGGGTTTYTQTGRYYSSGGGATDIRYFSSTPSSSDLVWNSSLGLNSRIMVAGAGAGHGYYSANDTCAPGVGGGLTGYNATGNYNNSTATDYGHGVGGTQVSGGNATNNTINGSTYNTKGSFGNASGIGAHIYGYSGGGSGYYAGSSSLHVEDGGGGSSYISGYLGCLAINGNSTSDPRTLKDGCTSTSRTFECSKHYSDLYFNDAVMIDGKGCNWSTGSAANCGENQPQPNGTNAIGHSGNGYAKITYIGRRVNLDPNGGTLASNSVYSIDTLGTLPTPTKTGYVFTGWVDDNNNAVSANTSIKDIPNYNLTATYRPITYKVRFNANGGTGNMPDETFTYDQAKALSSNGFTRSGKTFVGWSTVSGNQLLYYSATEKVSTNNEFMQYGVDLSPYFNTYGIRDYSMMLDIKSANISKANYQVVYCQNGNGSQWGWNNVNFIVSTSYQTFDFSFVPIRGNNSYTTSQLALYGVYNTGNYPSAKNVYLFLGKFYRNSKQISNLTATDGEIIDLYAVWR